MHISTISKVVLGFAVVAFILVLPFAASMVVHEYRLWGFARQLDSVAQFLPDHADMIARGSQIYVSGNGEACSYRVVTVHSVHAQPEELDNIKEKIRKLAFEPVKKGSGENRPEVYISSRDFLLFVVLVDGPYRPGLDIRCW